MEMGFQDEMQEIIGKLPTVERRILLSATEAESIPKFVNMGRNMRVDYRDEEEKSPQSCSTAHRS